MEQARGIRRCNHHHTDGSLRAREDDHVVVECPRLEFDGHRLALSTPETRSIPIWTDGYAAVPDAAPGQLVAPHWDRLCGRLTRTRARAPAISTEHQLPATDRSLARATTRAADT